MREKEGQIRAQTHERFRRYTHIYILRYHVDIHKLHTHTDRQTHTHALAGACALVVRKYKILFSFID